MICALGRGPRLVFDLEHFVAAPTKNNVSCYRGGRHHEGWPGYVVASGIQRWVEGQHVNFLREAQTRSDGGQAVQAGPANDDSRWCDANSWFAICKGPSVTIYVL